jgi:preprotein translocase SecF subunit
MLQAFETPRVPFTRYRRPFIAASVVIIAATWLLVIWRGMENYGIEFTGGARVTMNLSRPVKVDDLRAKIRDLAKDNPELFRDWTLQTLQAEGAGTARRYSLLTRAGAAGGKPAEAEEPAPAAPGAKAPEETAKPAEPAPAAPEAKAAGEPGGPAEPVPPPETKALEGGGVGAPPPQGAAEPEQPRAAPRPEPAQEVRRVLEGMLEREGWLVPTAFPRIQWEPAPGGPPGSERLLLEVNVLAQKDKEPLTVDDLKGRLNAALEGDALFTTAGRDPGAAYKGVQIESVDVLETGVPADESPVKRYLLRATPFVPRLQAERTELAVPSREQVIDGIRKFFTDQGRKNQLQLSEPFSEVATVGKRVASTLQADALVAIFIAIVGIVFYMSLRFEFIYGVAGIVALVHDVMVAIGITALTDQLLSTSFPVKINLNELAAILTIIGFSINDTIVLFDRIRENAELHAKRKISLEENIDLSINQTLSRTIWTSVTVLLVTVVLLGFGGEAIRGFAFLFAVGTVAGVYSTVFIASPVALWLHKRAAARREAQAALEEAADRRRG